MAGVQERSTLSKFWEAISLLWRVAETIENQIYE